MYDTRIYIPYSSTVEASELLDDRGIENDLDMGDRIMVSEDDLSEVMFIFDEAGIDYDVV